MFARTVGQAFFRLDKAWELDGSVYSPELKRQMVWLSGLLPYSQAEAVMKRIGKRAISDSSLWRTVEKQGQRLEGELKPDTVDVPRGIQPDELVCRGEALSMDGAMVNIRQEGWKELKVGLVGNVVSENPAQFSVIPEVHLVQQAYTAVLGDVEQFTTALLRTAANYDFFSATQSSVVADGAAWIWTVASAHFQNSVQIVDWYHAREHLAAAAQAYFPDQPLKAAAWLKSRTDSLFDGPLVSLLTELNQLGLSEHAHYFQTHQSRMRYLDFSRAGLPIGSGSVESEVKQFKHRLAAPGMRWSRAGAERMIPFRAAVLDNSFDARWSHAA